MVWFRVDDNLALHPKVIEAGNAAMGVWVRAGAWSASNLTDGLIPTRVALRLGSRNLCYRLINAGLFVEVPEGFQFHAWDEKNFTKNQIEAYREQERKRKADQRKRHLSTVPTGVDVPVGHPPDSPDPIPSLPISTSFQSNGHHRGVAPRAPSAAPAATASLPLCPFGCHERDGYRENGTVCDHIDHTETYKRGSAAAREALAAIRNKKAASG